MATYLTVTYVTKQVGSDWLIKALDADATTYGTVSAAFTGVNEAASAIVGTYLRRMEYTVPATAGTADDLKAVTFAVFYEMLHSRPENMLTLPDTWQFHPSKMLLEELKTGEAHLSLSQSTEGPIGGVKFSESSTTVSTSDGSRQNIFSRKRMVGY